MHLRNILESQLTLCVQKHKKINDAIWQAATVTLTIMYST